MATRPARRSVLIEKRHECPLFCACRPVPIVRQKPINDEKVLFILIIFVF